MGCLEHSNDSINSRLLVFSLPISENLHSSEIGVSEIPLLNKLFTRDEFLFNLGSMHFFPSEKFGAKLIFNAPYGVPIHFSRMDSFDL